MLSEKEIWYWFCNIKGIGVRKGSKLLKHFHTPKELIYADANIIRKLEILASKDKEEILKSRNEENIKKGYNKLRSKNIRFVTRGDALFPDKLLHIPDAPFALYVKGELPREDTPVIAIVGARECSVYGKEMTHHFARVLSSMGIQVISGLARGIDRYAHEGALKEKGKTFGVLGCGIDICYPQENINLYVEMSRRGGILSEYSMGVPGIPGNFPMRNRIISGMSDGVLVIEAREKSGSLITADMALEQGKDVYALPGRAGDKLSEGSNNLIKMGAALVDKPEDILFSLSWNDVKIQDEMKKNNIVLESGEKIVYASLSLEPKHINHIMEDVGMSFIEIADLLVSLELKQVVRQITHNYYVINTI